MSTKKSNPIFLLPNIAIAKISPKIHRNRSAIMALTDDINFAKMQINKITHSISREKENKLKPWSKRTNNNIYISNGKTNSQIMRELSKKFQKIRINKDIKKINWENQIYYDKKQLNNIFDGYQISKKIKNEYDLKRKIQKTGFIMNNILSETKNISMDNLKINILKSERNRVGKKEILYERAMEHEKKSLIKDIEDFEDFRFEVRQKMKDDENTLIKLIQGNKLLYEEYKRLYLEYRFIIEEIFTYIKIIINCKSYIDFIHKILGGDSKVLNINLNEYKNYRNWSENDLHIHIKNVLNEVNELIVELSLDDKAIDILSDKERIEMFFSIMQDNILQVFGEKEKFENNEEIIMNENMKIYNKLKQDYENQKVKYGMYLKECEDEQKKIKEIIANTEMNEHTSYMNTLLKEIINYINRLNKKNYHPSESIYNNPKFYRNNIKKSINYLKKKECMIEELIDEIDGYIKEDKSLVSEIIEKLKTENMNKYRENEKRKILIKENINKQKIMEKFGQKVIKERLKFKEPIPYLILKGRKKLSIKKIPLSTRTNLLFY